MSGSHQSRALKFSRVLKSCVVPIALAALLAPALADDVVDLEIRAKDRVDGTLRPAEDAELFALKLPRGATLSASVKRKGAGGPTPQLELLDGTRAVVATGASTKTGAALAKTVVGASGTWRIRVKGDGTLDGDYLLKPKVKFQKKFDVSSDAPLAAAAETTAGFAALAGSTCSIDLIAGDAGFVPQLVRIDGPSGFTRTLVADKTTPKKQKVKSVLLPSTGDYTVTFSNGGAASGNWRCKVKVRSPKLFRNNVDLRDTELAGEFGGTQAVFGALIDNQGGLVVPLDALNLTDTQISIPVGALPSAAVIFVNEVEEFFVDDENHPASVAINLGPEGQQFAQAVTITIPFDPQAYEDPFTELQMFTVDADGNVELIPGPYDIDVENGTCSFPANHFSGFQSTSPRDRPVKGTYVEIELIGRLDDAASGDFTFGLNRIDADPGSRDNNLFTRTFERRTIGWERTGPGTAQVTANASTGQFLGIVQLENDEVVTLCSPGSDIHFVRGRSKNVLVGSDPGPDTMSFRALFRRAKGRPSRSNLVGRWHTFVLEFDASELSGGAVQVRQTGQTLALDVDNGLRVTASDVLTSTATAAFPTSGWNLSSGKRKLPPGTFEIDGPRVQFTMDIGAAGGGANGNGTGNDLGPVTLQPCLSGDLMIGMAGLGSPAGELEQRASRLVVMVRESKQQKPLQFPRRAVYRDFAVFAAQSPSTAGTFGTLAFERDILNFQFTSADEITFGGQRATLGFGPGLSPALSLETIDPVTRAYRLSDDGQLEAGGTFGAAALTRRREVLVATRFENGRFVLAFAMPARPSAPITRK